MQAKHCLLTTSLLVLVATAPALAAPEEVFSNGSFETASPDFAESWSRYEAGPGGAVAIVERRPGDADIAATDGGYYLFMEVAGVGTGGPVTNLSQDAPAGAVTPGAIYDFRLDVQGQTGIGTIMSYEVLWQDDDGSHGGGDKGLASGGSLDPTEDWSSIELYGVVAPTSADSAKIRVSLVTGSFDGAYGYLALDNISLAIAGPQGVPALPLPFLAMFGVLLGGAGMMTAQDD